MRGTRTSASRSRLATSHVATAMHRDTAIEHLGDEHQDQDARRRRDRCRPPERRVDRPARETHGAGGWRLRRAAASPLRPPAALPVRRPHRPRRRRTGPSASLTRTVPLPVTVCSAVLIPRTAIHGPRSSDLEQFGFLVLDQFVDLMRRTSPSSCRAPSRRGHLVLAGLAVLLDARQLVHGLATDVADRRPWRPRPCPWPA